MSPTRAGLKKLPDAARLRKDLRRNATTYGHHVKMVVDASGRPVPERKATRAEVERRRDHTVRLYRQGAHVVQIALALDVSADVVEADVRYRGVRLEKRQFGLAVDPPKTEWLTPVEEPRNTVAYQQSVTLSIWAAFTRESRAQHHANRLAHDALDAKDAGDQEWLAKAVDTLQAAIDEATRLRDVLTDHVARRRAQHEKPESTQLRAVR